MARQHDLPCPATAFTAEVNVSLLGIEALDARGADLTREETGAALRMALTLMQLSENHSEERRSRRTA